MSIDLAKAIESFRAAPAATFGGLIAWDLPRTNDKTLIDVRESLVKVGLDENLVPSRSHRETINIAIDLFEDKHEKSLLVRKIRDDESDVVYGIVHEGKDKMNDHLYYDQQTTVVMSKATGHLNGSGPHFEDFKDLFNWAASHAIPRDVQKVMLQVVSMVRGIAYRHGGGTYFYAASDKNVATVAAAAEFVRILGITPAHVSNVPLSGGPLQKAEIFHVAKEEVRKQVEAIRKAAENVTKRASSLSNHEAQLKDVEELMNYYVNLTQMEEVEEEREAEAKALRDMIAETEAFISNKMAEVEGMRKTA